MCLGLLARSAGLPPNLREGSNDLAIYRLAGEAILRREIPYRDFFIEYPPGSLPAFVPPALLSDDRDGYIALFSLEMALVLAAALALTALAARRLGGPQAWIAPALTFAAGATVLYPVAVTRYDAVVALTLAAAALCVALPGGRYLAYASLGLGAAAKLVPALGVLPLVLARRGRGLAIFLGTLALSFAPALLLGGSRFLAIVAYHASRGLQIESLPASVLIELGRVDDVVFAYGAFEARGRDAELAATLTLPLAGVLLLATALVAYREHAREPLGPGDFPRYTAALILAFMLGSKVLSPQYMIWLLPLVPLGAGGTAGLTFSAIFLAACWMTTQIFPLHYGDLLDLRSPGPELLLARNLLLVALWVLLLSVPRAARERQTP